METYENLLKEDILKLDPSGFDYGLSPLLDPSGRNCRYTISPEKLVNVEFDDMGACRTILNALDEGKTRQVFVRSGEHLVEITVYNEKRVWVQYDGYGWYELAETTLRRFFQIQTWVHLFKETGIIVSGGDLEEFFKRMLRRKEITYNREIIKIEDCTDWNIALKRIFLGDIIRVCGWEGLAVLAKDRLTISWKPI